MRVYMHGTGTPDSCEANEVLLTIASDTKKAKENLEENEYAKWVINLHNHMREKMGLPNKIFSIGRNKENTKAQLIFFDKEPDGKHYEVFTEEREDSFVPYIEVEE